jgi:peroxiredoxin
MTRKTNWWVIIGVSLAGMCLVACLGISLLIHFAPNIYEYSLNQSSLQVGTAAPDFELTALSGESVRLSQYRGQPVLLTFAATWCPDCRTETPLLQKLHTSHPELNMVLVDSNESAPIVQDFVDEFGITQTVLLDRYGTISKKYQIVAIPTQLFIDADGIIQAKLIEGITPQVLAEKLPLIGIEP